MKPLTAVEPRIGTEEWQARVELAACYRLLAHFGLNDLTYNHLSVRVPGEPDRLLVKPSSFFFDEVTASNLLKFSLDGTPHQAGAPNRGGAHVIHAGILGARPDLNAVFHTHTVAGAAVSAQKHGLLMLSQHAVAFHRRVAYHDFGGFEFNVDQREPLLSALGDKRYAILRNHGLLVCGANLPQTFVDHHFLDMACRIQVDALAGNSEVTLIDERVCEKAATQYETIDANRAGGKDWGACLRLLDRLDPSYKQ